MNMGRVNPSTKDFLSEPMGQTALLDRVGAKFLREGGGRVGLYPKMGTLGRRARELGWLSEHYQARSGSSAGA